MKILLVNGTGLLTDLERSFLKRYHCTIIISGDASDALNRAKSEMPDVIVLDSSISSSDPFQCCRKLKSQLETKSIPIIFLAFPEQVGKCREAGCDCIIEKPIQKETFLRHLSRFIDLAERESERIHVVKKVHCNMKDSAPFKLYSKDLSISGIFLKSRNPLPVGSLIEMNFLLSGRGDKRIRASGEVVRCIEHERDSHLIAGMGIRFREMKAADRLAINHFLGGKGK
ncbi:MAG: PilZ domain-containing protein [Acidobacteriota bacterium]